MSHIKRFNISKPEKYFKGEEEKTAWKNVGTLTEFHKDDGTISRVVEIPAIGLKASVFEEKPREDNTAATKPIARPAQRPQSKEEEVATIEYPEEEINAEDIPF